MHTGGFETSPKHVCVRTRGEWWAVAYTSRVVTLTDIVLVAEPT